MRSQAPYYALFQLTGFTIGAHKNVSVTSPARVSASEAVVLAIEPEDYEVLRPDGVLASKPKTRMPQRVFSSTIGLTNFIRNGLKPRKHERLTAR